MKEVTVEIPARTETHAFRTQSVTIEMPEGGPFILRVEREKIISVEGKEVARVAKHFPIRREFAPEDPKFELSEFLGKMLAQIEEYAAADGEK